MAKRGEIGISAIFLSIFGIMCILSLSLGSASIPHVTINAPANKTYSINTIPVSIESNEYGYCTGSINGGKQNMTLKTNTNFTFNGNLTALPNSNYTFQAYCRDDVGNWNNLAKVTFNVNVMQLVKVNMTNLSEKSCSYYTFSWGSMEAGRQYNLRPCVDEPGIALIGIFPNSDLKWISLSMSSTVNRPSDISTDKKGKIFRYIRLSSVNLTNYTLSLSIVLNRSWVSSNILKPENFSLCKYIEPLKEWKEIPFRYLRRDSEYMYYFTELSTVGYYVIAERKNESMASALEIAYQEKPKSTNSTNASHPKAQNISSNATSSTNVQSQNAPATGNESAQSLQPPSEFPFTKKLIYIAGGVVGLGAIITLVFIFFGKKASPQRPGPTKGHSSAPDSAPPPSSDAPNQSTFHVNVED